MTAPLLTYQHAGMYVEIRYDYDAGDPRDDLDNLGSIVGWKQPDLKLGDRQVSIECTSPAEIVEALRKDGARLILPIFYTSHGPRCNLYMGDIADEDSLTYCSGVVYVSGEKLKSELGVRRVTTIAIKKATRLLRAEVAEYSAFLTGDVFGFTIRDDAGTEWESDWGFYGMKDCEHDANDAAERSAEQQQAETEEAHEMACRDIPTVAA
jgi:hypothetical protein